MELKEDIRVVSRPNKVFIYSAEEGELFETNQIGEVIIKKLKEKASEQEIVDYLCKETEADRKQIEEDFAKFIQQLKEKQFLK